MMTFIRTPRALAALLAATCAAPIAGCAANQPAPAGAIRFHNREPVWLVNDRRNIAKPAERPFFKALYHFDGYVYGRADRRMELPPIQRAQNINALGEVPDSTWFTNRIGMRDITPEEIAAGPNVTGSPEDHKPWIIRSSKVGGITPGFIVEDQRGVRYVLKFDMKGIPEVETGADVILQRLLWACGYNVPEDHVVRFRREDLVIAPDAVIRDPMGNKKPLSRRFFDQQLALINVDPDGTIRGLASQFLPGVPLSGHPRQGVRKDDPNDRIPHQLRRDLRGQYAFFSWLDQTDAKEDNSLDVYVEDPARPGVHYVVHYLLDFGKGLGVQPFINGRRFIGHGYLVDFPDIAASTVSLGTWQRSWENRKPPGIRGVGLLDSESFDPGSWHAYSPSYFPFLDADRFDNFWAAKILIRFTPDHIRAAVAQARFTDHRANDYITQVLIERQRKVARHWFNQVNPLDRFAVSEERGAWTLCFDDLALIHTLQQSLVSPTHYTARAYGPDGVDTTWRGRVRASTTGRTCLPGVPPTAAADSYTIVQLFTNRRGPQLPGTRIHLARNPTSKQPRVIGLERL
jgi:hypothetical protein